MERKLASIRKIKNIEPIDGADKIELVTVDGWKVVVAKDVNHKIGDFVVYCEIDSFLPIRDEFEFLRKSSYKKMGNQEGFRLKTIRLRGVLSQGLILPISILEGDDEMKIGISKQPWGDQLQIGPYDDAIVVEEGIDVTEYLGILKWEPPVPAELAGKVKGYFPSYIPKTDENRIQNLSDSYNDLKQNVYYVTEKLDGCLDGSTLITTENGELTIKELCETNYNGKVLTYDINTNEIRYERVVNTFIKEPTTHQWYRIVLDNGRQIVLTGNHMIWIPDLMCWRRVDELDGTENFLLKN